MEGKKVRVFLLLAQSFGWIAALALIMTGVFSEGAHASHSLWSAILYISFGMAVFLSGWGFRRSRSLPHSLAYLAFTVTVIIWVMSAFNKTHVLEWIVVALLLIYVGVVSRRLLIARGSTQIAGVTLPG
jgi:hypothetical membrane protein